MSSATFKNEPSISADQLLSSVWNHKLLVFLVLSCTLAGAVGLYKWLPRSYGSEGLLYIQLGRGNIGLDPNPNDSRSFAVQDSRETEILSVVELLKGRGLLAEVVKDIGPERILENQLKIPFADKLMELVSTGGEVVGEELPEDYEVLKLREEAVKKLMGDLSVASEKKTSVVSVYCKAATPILAKQIVDKIMERLREQHVHVHAVERSRSFFESEFALKEADLAESESRLRDFRNKHGFLSADDARSTLDSVLSKLENELVDVRVALTESLTTIEELKSQIAEISEKIEVPTIGMESSSTEGAQTQLNSRLAERARLLTTFTKADPRVVAIDQEIELLRKDVENLPKERTESSMSQNPIFENSQIALIQETANSRALQARMEKVESEFEAAQLRLVELNNLKLEEDQLLRDMRVKNEHLDIYVTKRGEANVIDRLDEESISDVVIAQEGSIILKKVAPKGSLIFAAALMFGCMAALTGCVWMDRDLYLGRSVSSERLEDTLGIPVLATVPRVRTSQLQNHG